MYNHQDLVWQFGWSGARLQNLQILVCDRCLDVPQEQLRAKILSADPLPIYNARPEPFTYTGYSYQESNIICLPNGQNSSGVGGLGGDGGNLLLPDGVTTLLMPTYGSGVTIGIYGSGDFNPDFSTDFSGGV